MEIFLPYTLRREVKIKIKKNKREKKENIKGG